MNKVQLSKYQKRYQQIKKHLSDEDFTKNPYFKGLLKAAESSLKNLNQKNLPEETHKLSKKQLDIILSTFETEIK